MACIEWPALAHDLEVFETLPEVFERSNSLDKPDSIGATWNVSSTPQARCAYIMMDQQPNREKEEVGRVLSQAPLHQAAKRLQVTDQPNLNEAPEWRDSVGNVMPQARDGVGVLRWYYRSPS